MEQNQQQFKCSGDCTKCHQVQRQYCAAQKGYDNQQLLLSLIGEVKELAAKVNAIQSNEALVFNPNEAEEPTDISQEGDGEEE